VIAGLIIPYDCNASPKNHVRFALWHRTQAPFELKIDIRTVPEGPWTQPSGIADPNNHHTVITLTATIDVNSTAARCHTKKKL
jgi:hypothetical protein